MITLTMCVHGIYPKRACALCVIDRPERIGAVGPIVSGVCDTTHGYAEHERCRMFGCECSCHKGEDFGQQLGRGLGVRP